MSSNSLTSASSSSSSLLSAIESRLVLSTPFPRTIETDVALGALIQDESRILASFSTISKSSEENPTDEDGPFSIERRLFGRPLASALMEALSASMSEDSSQSPPSWPFYALLLRVLITIRRLRQSDELSCLCRSCDPEAVKFRETLEASLCLQERALLVPCDLPTRFIANSALGPMRLVAIAQALSLQMETIGTALKTAALAEAYQREAAVSLVLLRAVITE